MRIAVFGAGGVGGYFGGRLAQAGEDIVLIARGDHLRAIRDSGLRVTSADGDFVVQPTLATDDPSTVGPVDAILLGVKTWQVAEAAEAMRPMVGPRTFVVPLQNGVEAPERLAEVLGAEHVLGGLCQIIGYVVAPGQIRHAGVEPYIAFGELNATSSERTERLRQAFARTSAVRVEIPPDIRVAMWRKFLFIAAWSGLGAVTRAPIGILRREPETRQLLEQALREIYAVALGHRIALPSDVVEKTLAFIDGLPPEGTSSMQRDITQGRPSELAAQSGAIVRLGREARVAVPLHSFIYAALLPLERRARGEVEFTS